MNYRRFRPASSYTQNLQKQTNRDYAIFQTSGIADKYENVNPQLFRYCRDNSYMHCRFDMSKNSEERYYLINQMKFVNKLSYDQESLDKGLRLSLYKKYPPHSIQFR